MSPRRVVARVPATDAANTPPATRLVQRERVRRAINAKTAETRWLGGYADSERESALAGRFEEALALCQEAQWELEQGRRRAAQTQRVPLPRSTARGRRRRESRAFERPGVLNQPAVDDPSAG